MNTAIGNIPAKSQKQEKTKRQYQEIWDRIKAVAVGEVVPVRCNTAMVKRLKQAVIKEKNRDAGLKKKLGMHTAGRMIITVEPDKQDKEKSIVNFSLSYDNGRL